MMLFERVRLTYQNLSISQAVFARSLGLTPATFNGYLKESREANLWPLLDKILMVYPQTSRDWLYFGEGEMLAAPDATGQTSRNMETLQARVHELEAELAEERRLNRRLTETLLDKEVHSHD